MNDRKQFAAALKLAKAAAEEAGGQPPCSNAPDLWFDAANNEKDGVDTIPTQADFSVAKRLCLNCDILLQCRTYAIEFKEPYGVWGATTPLERRRIWREIDRNTNADSNRRYPRR